MAKPVPAKVTLTRTPLNGDPEQVLRFDYDAATPVWLQPFQIQRSVSNGVSGLELVLDNEGRRFNDWEPGDLIHLEVQGLLDVIPYAAFSGFINHAAEEIGVEPRLHVQVLSLKELLDAITVRAVAPAAGDFLCTEDGIDITAETGDELLVEVGFTYEDGEALMTEDFDVLLTEAGEELVVEKA